MPEPIISVSGLRGVIGESLSPEVALRYACAFAADLPAGPLVLSQDGRPSGPMLADAVRAALVGVGRDVLDAGIAATPTVGVLVRAHGAAGAVQVSASHNPPEYNGIKLFSSQGRVISADLGSRVEDRYRTSAPAWAAHDAIGTPRRLDDTASEHLRLILATVDAERIRARRFRVLLDSNHASGSLLGRRLLDELGCRVTHLGAEPHGRFAHPAEPAAENLASVLPRVTESGCDVGFCQDPDADRLAVLDEQGRYLGEEYTLALCLDHVLAARPGPIVVNCATSRMAEHVAEKHGVPLRRTSVGEAHVVAEMLASDAVLGGEGNGGVIDPRVGLVRDSFVGMALILDSMAARDLPPSGLAAELPRYEMLKTKVPLDPAKVNAALAALERTFPDAIADHSDGLRLAWPDRWLLVRRSNTEPIVRAIAEAPTPAAARSLTDRAAQVLRSAE